jgi:hypothetical protein
MAKGHWLDPLARGLLRAAGQLPPPRRAPNGRPGTAEPAARPLVRADTLEAADHGEAIERELLALKLARTPALRLRDAGEVRHAAALGWRLDVNRATAADWLRLPGCKPGQVDLLLRLQEGGVQLSGPEDLQRVLELSDAQLQCWLPLLEFRWYGEPPPRLPAPVDLNQAGLDQLQSRLPLDSEACGRLLRERGRGPFRDLADLQQRLRLSAPLVEGLIGKVRFSQGPIGPDLPRPQRPSSAA